VYAVKILALSLHRRPESIRFWEYKKIFPKPIIKTTDGCRWYTKEEIALYTRLAEEEQIKNGKSFRFTKFTARCFGEAKLLENKLFTRIRKCAGSGM
jgi:hypothetical protein